MTINKINFLSITLTVILIFSIESFSQSNVENILGQILKNNKSLLANSQLMESKKLEFKTGQSLYNPFVEITNLFGPTKESGNQTEFKLIQPFDFPTSYTKRNKLTDLKVQQTSFERQIYRQDILLEAKLICIELINLNKRKVRLTGRAGIMQTLKDLYQTKLDKGEGNILDVNKSKINLLNINTDLMVIENRINELNEKLTELNGGNRIIFSDTTYPIIPVIPDFNQLENTIETNDPLRKSLHQEKLINKGQTELSKTLSLPKFELGYYYLGLTDQKFHGFHFGFSIPLWENNYRTDLHRSRTLYSELEIEAHKNEHYYEIKQMYTRYETLKEALNEYEQILQSTNNEQVLLNALNIGEISATDYFLEANYIYNSYDKFLELEKEYHKVIAELYKYQL